MALNKFRLPKIISDRYNAIEVQQNHLIFYPSDFFNHRHLKSSPRFPEEGQALRRLFQESLSFQSLCHDYRECLAALQRWQQSTSEDALALRDEYAHLLLERAHEVREYLANPASFSTGPR
jgi:hypothetical protein